jgi:hypothetical protein
MGISLIPFSLRNDIKDTQNVIKIEIDINHSTSLLYHTYYSSPRKSYKPKIYYFCTDKNQKQ